jgi:histidinol-phosphate phosphatase family protein
MRISYSMENRPLGTGGALQQAYERFGGGRTWLVMNGDSYAGIGLAEMLREHERTAALATIAAVHVEDASRYGSIEIGADGRIAAFREKGAAASGWISAGIYALAPAFLEAIPSRAPLSLEYDVFPEWIPRGLQAFARCAPFIDIGTPESYAAAQSFFDAKLCAAKRFVLLDRDGTINVEKNYLSSPVELELLPGATAGLRAMSELGLGLAMLTNQSGIGRGYFSAETVCAIHAALAGMLAEGGVTLDGIYVCPHVPEDRCACRKPVPGLAEQAAHELGFALADAFVIGDKACDIELGRRCGATTILVRTGYGQETEAAGESRPDYVADNLLAAARIIEGILKQQPA